MKTTVLRISAVLLELKCTYSSIKETGWRGESVTRVMEVCPCTVRTCCKYNSV